MGHPWRKDVFPCIGLVQRLIIVSLCRVTKGYTSVAFWGTCFTCFSSAIWRSLVLRGTAVNSSDKTPLGPHEINWRPVRDFSKQDLCCAPALHATQGITQGQILEPSIHEQKLFPTYPLQDRWLAPAHHTVKPRPAGVGLPQPRKRL